MNRFINPLFYTIPFFLWSIGTADQNLEALYDKGAYKDCIKYADLNLPTASRTSDVWLTLGASNEKLALWEKALACYTIVAKSTDAYSAQVGLARVYRNMGRNEKSLEAAKIALEKKFDKEALWEFVKTSQVLGNKDDVQKGLQQIVQIAPADAQAQSDLGRFYLSLQQTEKALPHLKAAYQSKSDVAAGCLLAQTYSATGNPQAALALLKDMSRTKGLSNSLALDLARAYFSCGEHENALREYESILRNGKLQANDLYSLAVCREKVHGMKSAAEAYSTAAKSFGDATSPEALDCRVKSGMAMLDSKNWKGASAHFLFVMKADPKADARPELAIGLADAYCGLKQNADAIRVLEKAIKDNASNLAAYSRLAELYAAAKMPEKAKSVLERMASLNPRDPKVFASLGQYHLNAGNTENALGYFNRSNQIVENADASEGIAVCSFKLERRDMAKFAAELALKLDENRWSCRSILAQIYLEDGEYKEGAKHLERLVKHEPKNVTYWRQLATCYQHTNSIAKLSAADQNISELDKKDVDSRVRLASVALSQGNRKIAYALYTELVTLIGSNDRVLRMAADLSKEFGTKTETLSYLKKYLSIKPKDAAAQAEMGDLLIALNDQTGAEQSFRAAVAINSKIPGVHKKIIQLVKARGIEQELVDALQQAVTAGQADGEIFSALAHLCQKAKEYGKAIELYEKAMQSMKGDAAILSSMAMCQTQIGDASGAIISYEQALMISPKLVNEYKFLGDLYLKEKRTEQAMKCYRKYLDRVSTDWELAKIVGLNSYYAGRYDEAAKYLGMVKGAESQDANHLMTYGEACFRSGDFARTIKIYEDLARFDKKTFTSERVLRLLGQSYEKELNELKAGQAYAAYTALETVRDPDAAYKSGFYQEKFQIEASRKIYLANVRLYPNDYRNFYRLGLIYASKAQGLPEALFAFKKASELADTVPAIWEQLGRVSGLMKNEDNELLAWKKLLSLDSRHAEANKRAGIIQIGRGITSEGITCLEMANTLAPNDADVLSVLAKGYQKTGRFDNALVLLAKAHSIRGNDPEIAIPLAKLYSRSGEKNMAVEIMKGLAKKGETEHLRLYAELLSVCGRNGEAEEVIKTLCGRDKANKELLMFLARTQRAQEKYANAVDTYKKVSELDEGYTPAYYERAEAYMAMGKTVWAQVFYARAIEKDPKFALAELGLARVAKVNSNTEQYLAHLQNAEKLDPGNKLIRAELASAKE